MKYADRRLKGTAGYIRKQLFFESVKTVFLFAMALGLFFIGYFTLHTRKSLWSVFAVLALLPACRSLVGVIMFARFKSLSKDEYDMYSKAAGNIPVIYENILTTSSRTYYLPVICTAKGSVTAYCPSSNDPAIKEHIENVLKNAGYNVTVKVYDNREAFIKRCKEMDQKSDVIDKTASAAILNTLKAVSL